jgi:hypothetical protein
MDSSSASGSLHLSSVSAPNTYQKTLRAGSLQNHLQNSNSEEQICTPLYAVENENYTTVMIRNIPRGLSQTGFLEELNARGYRGSIDFAYMPMNLRSYESFGYAFVNLTDATVAAKLMSHLQLLAADEKEWQVVWSTCQGLTANVERYRNSPLMHESVPADCKPVLFDEYGDQVQFPAPTKHIAKPRIHYSKDKGQGKRE